ncbi:thioredoxin domain-containing protein [Chamaesiphon sp. VAR_48_metabat_135_sub]|uniref:TlpA family protein disulfide reductase n=1 Tax=Chamaesiphon sp. VAR_48_metabat_135_sub TaxID=2964699 RepID=UPI00286C1767|nr:thioredoxin domain-containing protein [Chamaesiphon sp. VAR_48_metabat_135_sub]
MKVKFLAAFAAISLLSIVTVAPTIIFSATTAVANPCAAKPNPCASKPNPCAGKVKAASSVGGPLAKQLQGKPVVIDIYASWCPACKNIAPTVSQIKQQYAGKINFVTLDVSTKASSAKAEATAKQLGLSEFFAANKTKTGSLLIVDPATGNILTQHKNNPDLTAYSTVLDSAIAKN